MDAQKQNSRFSWWMSLDPAGYKGGLNLYAYCGSAPVNCTDPTGLAAAENDKPVTIQSLLENAAKAAIMAAEQSLGSSLPPPDSNVYPAPIPIVQNPVPPTPILQPDEIHSLPDLINYGQNWYNNNFNPDISGDCQLNIDPSGSIGIQWTPEPSMSGQINYQPKAGRVMFSITWRP